MRKKWIGLLLLLILLAVLLVRHGRERAAEPLALPAVGQTTAQSGETKPAKVQRLGAVTATEDGGIQIETDEGSYSFSDVSVEDWCVDAVNFAVTNGLMVGMDDGNGKTLFRPDNGISRAQLAMVLYSFAGGEETAAPTRSFSDVTESDWYYSCVSWAVGNGYIEPASADTFGAEEFCSCEETLTILHRVAGSPVSTTPLEDYPYAAKVSENALVAMRWAWEKGLIAEDECVWYPTQAVSRAQIALLLMRYDALT